ncbi:uncharacterized protein METZ01_LOCUS229404 [marine metagenome]|uniref:Uncharacterized protein n=1 Tax=marine metagenome TaxID=408172 RepID=A0A382GN25_9ZZZZ
MAEQLPVEQIPEGIPEGIIDGGQPVPPMIDDPSGTFNPVYASQSLEQDDELNNELANRMVISAKEQMYGQNFDQAMEMFQQSENFVVDAGMLALNLIQTDLSALAGNGKSPPYDFLMDVAAEVVAEVYQMAMQTGVYAPNSEEELQRNQNVSLTMVAGELGKDMGNQGMLDGKETQIGDFMNQVADGGYDNFEEESLAEQMGQMGPQMGQPEIPPEMPPMQGV